MTFLVRILSYMPFFFFVGCAKDGPTHVEPFPQHKIAFGASDSIGEYLYLVNPDGRGLKKLIKLEGVTFSLKWSPNGEKISFDNYNISLRVVNRDGSGFLKLDSISVANGYSWSSDGTKVVFSSWTGNICVINANGSDLRTLTTNGSYPAWSPDGGKIAFERESTLYVMNSDGSNEKMLVDSITRLSGWDEFSWSPTGGKIAYVDNGQIYVIFVDGSSKSNITRDGSIHVRPIWSPDGTKIAFRNSTAPSGIFVVDHDGSNVQRITQDDYGSFPIWSPDGKQVAYGSQDGIYLIHSDGTGKTKVTDLKPGLIAWSPVASP